MHRILLREVVIDAREPPFYGYYRLPAFVAKVRELVDPEPATELVEQAVRLRCPGATDW